MEDQKVFRSRISVLLLGFTLAIFIPCTIPMIKHMIIPGLFIMGGSFLFIVILFTGMRYIISGDKLFVKIGNIPCGSVKITNIISVERSYNPLSSPAASLKRLSISLDGKAKFPYMLISPVREKEFIEELKMLNPNIFVRVPDKKGIWRVQDWDI
ncbi:PH domain-containing protein [Proteiniphilum acetatigenes]|uniref:PH domain-containing protein n=1 Tax=Proteiniphilum acetatigenes TaxID=294710 RepID=UPI000365A9FC|nr:PH domain-containing protein [Proteiniphilum acetatigenes]